MNIAIIATGAMGCLFALPLVLDGVRGSLVEVDTASIMAIAEHGLHFGEHQHQLRLPFSGEEMKYCLMGRADAFPEPGKPYRIEWTQFQGTAPMV
ncbi:MAG TPA: hypothetical protein VGC62_05615 [Pseudomonas sp.]|uniref:hypothetical protein n=1 Tax=Pseudomonas sp. TaxID=306 RepID=UPI002ED920B8